MLGEESFTKGTAPWTSIGSGGFDCSAGWGQCALWLHGRRPWWLRLQRGPWAVCCLVACQPQYGHVGPWRIGIVHHGCFLALWCLVIRPPVCTQKGERRTKMHTVRRSFKSVASLRQCSATFSRFQQTSANNFSRLQQTSADFIKPQHTSADFGQEPLDDSIFHQTAVDFKFPPTPAKIPKFHRTSANFGQFRQENYKWSKTQHVTQQKAQNNETF